MADYFADHCPVSAAWRREHGGWIEIGRDDGQASRVRVLDAGGIIWESGTDAASIDQALCDAEQAIDAWQAVSG